MLSTIRPCPRSIEPMYIIAHGGLCRRWSGGPYPAIPVSGGRHIPGPGWVSGVPIHTLYDSEQPSIKSVPTRGGTASRLRG
jgi:hypothetical protein